ncbi:MAG: hypothetical protein KDA21_06740, partial [Phycisphaerales bacterium]|nr:hypothetical protein [Phycisphaerales bacterium]
CPLVTLMRLREFHHEDLRDLNDLVTRHREHIRMATFVFNLTVNAADRNPDDADDYWGALIGKYGGLATGPGDAWVKQEIDERVAAIEKQRRKAEDSATDLIEFLLQEHVQQHLILDHDFEMCAEHVLEFYDVDLDDWNSDPDRARYIHSDHILAVVTEQLAATEVGRDFINQALKLSARQSDMPAFDKTWGHFQKTRSITEAMGKFLHNHMPGFIEAVGQVVNESYARTIHEALDIPTVRLQINAIKARTGVDVTQALRDRANEFATRSNAAATRLNQRRGLKSLLKQFDDVTEGKIAGHAAALDSSWTRITLGAVSLGLACTQIKDEWKPEDWLSTVSGAMEFAATLTETGAASLGASGQIIKADKVAGVAKTIGVLGFFVGMCVSLIDASRHVRNRDWDEAAVAFAGVAVSYVGFIAGLCGAAMVTGVCAIIGIAIAIIAALIVDPPIVNFLEKSRWGKSGEKFALGATMDEFFKEFMSISEISTPNKIVPDGRLEIVSNGLQEHRAVHVRIQDVESLATWDRNLVPAQGSQNGHGILNFVKGTPNTAVGPIGLYVASQKLRIEHWWEIWPDVKRDGKTKYRITVELDPDGDSVNEVKESKVVTFPRP